ncbi:MAG: RNA pseudouridine synthase [Coxiella sp. RIFCSPHIGHO2_12_FULL_42_15]|nr:MAG: RNA pseudouridine synthase [Coxiella sp. RIFCSPHIGHO2_12_FULL_42_15]
MNTNQTIILQQTIPTPLAGQRLDQALAKLFPEYSRTQLQHWIKAGFVTVDGLVSTQPRQKMTTGALITLHATLKLPTNWTAQDITLSIVFEDDDLIIVNKPAGLVVHPGAGNPDKTLVNALLHHNPTLATLPRAGIIHRLDKDTTGLLIITKNLPAHHALTQALKARDIKREYLALVKGAMISGGTIDAPIGRHSTQRTKMTVTPNGRSAITHYRILEKFPTYTYLHVELETGRTHQIRVHFNHIHHPVVGDPLYGKHITMPGKFNEAVKQALKQWQRQALHAFRLSFRHPITKKYNEFEVPLPQDFEQLLQTLRENE